MAGLSPSGAGKWCMRTAESKNSKLNPMPDNTSRAAMRPERLFIEVTGTDWCATSAPNFSIRYCVLRLACPCNVQRTSEVCPRAARKAQTYRSLRSFLLAALAPSAGTISLHVKMRLARVSSAPVSVGLHACPYRKFHPVGIGGRIV